MRIFFEISVGGFATDVCVFDGLPRALRDGVAREMYKGSTKEEQTATVLLDLTRLSA